jgi:two-component system sensor histidine kinase KdpD
VDIAALVALATASLVTTSLASRARREKRAAQREHRSVLRLYELAQRLLGLNPLNTDLDAVAAAACGALDLHAFCLFDGSGARVHRSGVSAYNLESRTRDAYITGRDADDSDGGVAVRCLRSGGKALGAVGFEGMPGSAEFAGSAAAVIAAALLRQRAALTASEAEAEARSQTLRAAILDALAHEFKTPLATILTAAGGLRAAAPLVPEQEELAEIVESETERLSSLSSRLLRIARLDHEEVKPRLEPVDVAMLVSEAVDRQSRQSPDRTFPVAMEGGPEAVAGDVELLQLALGQLLDNACRYSPARSPVKLRVSTSAGWVHIVVWNSGEAIEPAERELIFQRLYRGRGGRKMSGGTGLGLYVARKIALAHGGDLRLEESADPGGVAFRLTLPLAKGELSLAQSRA